MILGPVPLPVNQATVTATPFGPSTIGDWTVLDTGTTVLTVGLHAVDCALFVANAAPAQQTFKVEFMVNSPSYPTLNYRQLVQPPYILRAEGTP